MQHPRHIACSIANPFALGCTNRLELVASPASNDGFIIPLAGGLGLLGAMVRLVIDFLGRLSFERGSFIRVRRRKMDQGDGFHQHSSCNLLVPTQQRPQHAGSRHDGDQQMAGIWSLLVEEKGSLGPPAESLGRPRRTNTQLQDETGASEEANRGGGGPLGKRERQVEKKRPTSPWGGVKPDSDPGPVSCRRDEYWPLIGQVASPRREDERCGRLARLGACRKPVAGEIAELRSPLRPGQTRGG